MLPIKLNNLENPFPIVIGGIIGTVFEFNKESTYGADMQVQPNFKNSKNNIKR